jgi:hypothetical protein
LRLRHGTLRAVMLHNAEEEPLCGDCRAYIAWLQTQAIMSPRLRGMTPEERNRALINERLGRKPDAT